MLLLMLTEMSHPAGLVTRLSNPPWLPQGAEITLLLIDFTVVSQPGRSIGGTLLVWFEKGVARRLSDARLSHGPRTGVYCRQSRRRSAGT